MLDIYPLNLVIGTNGILAISLRFKQLSMQYGNRYFRLRFSPIFPLETNLQSGPLNPESLSSIITEPLCIVYLI